MFFESSSIEKCLFLRRRGIVVVVEVCLREVFERELNQLELVVEGRIEKCRRELQKAKSRTNPSEMIRQLRRRKTNLSFVNFIGEISTIEDVTNAQSFAVISQRHQTLDQSIWIGVFDAQQTFVQRFFFVSSRREEEQTREEILLVTRFALDSFSIDQIEGFLFRPLTIETRRTM